MEGSLNNRKGISGVLLSMLMVISMLFNVLPTTVLAEGSPKEVTATITNFEIQNLSGQKADKVFVSDKFYLSMNWDASSNGVGLNEGDYFDITLPDKMKFPPDTTASDFDILGPDGVTVIAKAHVTPGPGDKGGKVRVTFTNWVNGKENIKGDIRLAAQFDREAVKKNEKNHFDIAVSGKVIPADVTVVGPVDLPHDEMLAKWGQSAADPNQAEWWVRVNYAKAHLTNAVITDHLTGGIGNETYIPSSFRLVHVEYNSTGDNKQVYGEVDLSDKLTFSPDNKTFKINLGEVNGEQYRLIYRTTYTPGTRLVNNVNIKSNETSNETHGSHISANSGGSGTGNLANKIKLIKVDADDNAITLANAVFEVTRPDGTKFELTTGTDGTVTSGALTSGTYKVKEKTAPIGYELNRDEYTLQVTSSGGAIQTITNKQIKTSVSVEKEWIGQPATSVTVKLLADNVEKESIVLNAGNNWKHTFNNLPKHDRIDGHEIVYTVKEEQIANYDPAITGDMASGFKITNTNTEKISIPVEKKWVGPAVARVDVKLLVDGEERETLTLSAANHWKGEFEELYKYDPVDGHEIQYTVKEVAVEGYTSAISGTVQTGFTITNTITGKVSVPVTKKWIGKEADSVTVHLYADGTDTGKSATLNAANQWQYTFANLEQYKDGKAINYTIKEDSIAGYETKVTGDMKGYIVTNTNTEKLTIPVEKKWIGKEAAQVDVKLLVDGEEKETLTLNAANQWKGEFKNLYKYDQTDGHEIQYTVKEVTVEGYTSAISGTAQTGFTITNTKNPVPPTTPKTGDNSNLSLYIGVAVVALAILGFVIVKRFKSRK